nr:immunoglobulin light chain junction region [Macaca mulatta]MOX69147.1 immunoglobulin light chain junction region [Macaca mulatta]MOX74233.1 immunoglobulin light chain junction region [Macaca mulatta]
DYYCAIAHSSGDYIF